jgi:hypothetical protein
MLRFLPLLAFVLAGSAAPNVASITPNAAPGTTLSLIVDGSGFDAASSVPEVYDRAGRLVITGSVNQRSATRIVTTLPLAGARPGTYTLRVSNPGAQRSTGTPLVLYDEVSVSPPSGRPGTVFTYAGRGFTPRFGVTSHLQRPDGLEFQARRIATSAEGTFENQAILTGEFAAGIYALWATDDATGLTTHRVTFEIR